MIGVFSVDNLLALEEELLLCQVTAVSTLFSQHSLLDELLLTRQSCQTRIFALAGSQLFSDVSFSLIHAVVTICIDVLGTVTVDVLVKHFAFLFTL